MRSTARVTAILATALVLTLAGCSSQPTAPAKPAEPAKSAPAPAPQTGANDKLTAAKKDGKVVWYTSSFDLDTAKAVASGFEKKYSIPVELTRVTSQQVYQRITQEISANTVTADVITLTDEGRAITLSQQGHLMVYTPEGEDQLVKAYRGISAKADFHTHAVGAVIISYNTEKVKKEDVPKTWKDLLDPKWKGKVSIGHPGASGYVGTWFVQMQQSYGWDYLSKLAENNPLVGQSINDTVPKVISGERIIGVSSDGLVVQEKKKGSPIDFVIPEEGAILMTVPSMIMAKAPHPAAAKLFQDYLFSKEASQILVQMRGNPIRPDVDPDPMGVPVSKIKTQRPPGDVNQKMVPEIIEKFRSIFKV